MTTKDNFLFFKDKHKSFNYCFTDTEAQYSDLNLNQNLKGSNIFPFQSNSKLYNNKKIDSTFSENYKENKKSQTWKKLSMKDLCPKYSNILNDENEKCWKKNDSSNATNNSTLSLHISAYENSNEASSDSLKKSFQKSLIIQKQKNINPSSTFFSQNPFEFQRQQNDKMPEPETSQFKASQQLLNLNKSEVNFSTETCEKPTIDEGTSESLPLVLFKHLRTIHQTRQAPAVCNVEKFTLENVAAYNIQIDTGDTKTSSIVTLREVPSFLIEAFSKFEQLEGFKVEGVFRKEGNFSRCEEDAMPVFFGAQQISPNFLVHDVCVWIKKFFRELQQPLFANQETKLLQFVDCLNGDVLVGALLSLIDRLPVSHVGTLGYLMRCLQEIAESSHLHQMTVENLAIVFAPSLFRGLQKKATRMSKKRNGSQEDLLRMLKRTNDLQVLVLKVLIENAEKIGASKDFLKATKSAAGHNLMTAAKPPSGFTSGAYSKINSCLLRTSRSTTNLISEPSPSTRSPNNQRSNSVVRMALRSFKKSLTNLASEAFSSSYESAAPKMASKNQETTVDEIQGTGVVNRRIQQFKNLSLVNQPSPSGKESSFTKPLIKSLNQNCPSPQPKSINSSSSDNSSKSSKFGSNRAKSITSMYSTGSSTPNYARPSVSASSQMSLFPPPPPTKNIEGTIKLTR